jgi:hypothetical protein
MPQHGTLEQETGESRGSGARQCRKREAAARREHAGADIAANQEERPMRQVDEAQQAERQAQSQRQNEQEH